MWQKGECTEQTAYRCVGSDGGNVPVQSRITAYWPDGSVKWTAHTAESALLGEEIEVIPEEANTPCMAADRERNDAERPSYGTDVQAKSDGGRLATGISIEDDGAAIRINNGRYCIQVSRGSDCLFDRIYTDKGETASEGRAVLQLEEPIQTDGYEAKVTKPYTGVIKEMEIEEQGELQCILKYTGCHRNKDGEEKIPFVIRMRVNGDCPTLHFTHTFLYDGDEDRDFLKGLGIRFETPLSGELYNRHIKVQGDHGVFHEVMVPIMSWRPHVPGELYEAQIRGEKLALEGEELAVVDQMLRDTPYWSAYDIWFRGGQHSGMHPGFLGEISFRLYSEGTGRRQGGMQRLVLVALSGTYGFQALCQQGLQPGLL